MQYLSLSPEERTDSCAYNIDVHLCYCQAAVRLYTMFRKDWEAERMAKKIKNKNSSIKSKAKTKQLDQSRLVLTKQAGQSLGARPMYNPSDSEDKI